MSREKQRESKTNVIKLMTNRIRSEKMDEVRQSIAI